MSPATEPQRTEKKAEEFNGTYVVRQVFKPPKGFDVGDAVKIVNNGDKKATCTNGFGKELFFELFDANEFLSDARENFEQSISLVVYSEGGGKFVKFIVGSVFIPPSSQDQPEAVGIWIAEDGGKELPEDEIGSYSR